MSVSVCEKVATVHGWVHKTNVGCKSSIEEMTNNSGKKSTSDKKLFNVLLMASLIAVINERKRNS